MQDKNIKEFFVYDLNLPYMASNVRVCATSRVRMIVSHFLANPELGKNMHHQLNTSSVLEKY